MITGKLPTDHPHVWTGRCRQVSLCSESPPAVHLDGELFCRPEDGLREFEIGILPGALRVLRAPRQAA
jgi:diacylglycerol kinase family enzyme